MKVMVPCLLKQQSYQYEQGNCKVDGNSYFFNSYGVRQTSLIHVVTSSGKEFTGYFGENDSDGKMLTGKKSNLSVDGETAAYYFSESGSDKAAVIMVPKMIICIIRGRLVKADSVLTIRYSVLTIKCTWLMSPSKIQTSSKNYKVNGSWTFKVSGVLFISLMMIRNPQERLLLLMESFRK